VGGGWGCILERKEGERDVSSSVYEEVKIRKKRKKPMRQDESKWKDCK
jgi:hypothetical protein